MKRSVAASILFLILLVAPRPAPAGEVAVSYGFDRPLVKKTNDGFSLIVFPSAMQAGKAGEPSYPFRGACILLPEGERSCGVRIKRSGWRAIGEGIRLHPRQDPVPGLRQGDSRGFLYKASAYAVDRWVEPEASSFSTHYLRGHAIASGSFTPVSYRPSTGEAGYWSEIEVTILTIRDDYDGGGRLIRADAETAGRLLDIIDNDADLPAFHGVPAASASSEDDYEYLVVTRESLEDSFLPLKEFYDRRGIRTAIMTVEQIDIAWPGSDSAERIRNAVIAEYADHGITHLLLAGDGEPGTAATVPFRGLYCTVQSSTVYSDQNIPSDIYFASLDGNWNADGDALWGEPGEDDLFQEISVGRASVGSTAEATIFVEKTMMYQESPVAGDLRKALMLGEKLYSDPLTWGGDELDQLIGTCTAHGFTTTGLDSSFDIAKYYDRDLGSWSKTAVIDEVNAGTAWISHAGHSNPSYALRLSLGDVNTSNFTNDGIAANFPVVYTYGCYAGAFDYNDCISERIVNIETFACAILCHSRYGWFTEGTTNGPSNHFQREFFDALFAEGYTDLGTALLRAKDETVPFLDLPDEYEPGAHRWCFYCLNLLGDPALDGWTDAPLALSVSHPPCIATGDTAFAAVTNLPGALASLYGNGACYGRALARPDGIAFMRMYEEVTEETGSLVLTVTAHNRLVYRDTISVGCDTPVDIPGARTALMQNFPNPFNPSTTIVFFTARSGHVTLSVYDVAGREVARLADEEMEAGDHTVEWRPEGLSSGLYFYLLDTADARIARKAVLIR